MRQLLAFCLVFSAAACADEDTPALTDAGGDTGVDTGVDAGTDVGTDPGSDGAMDVLDDAADVTTDVGPDSVADSGTDTPSGDVGGGTWAALYADHLEPAGCSNGYCHGGGAGGLNFTDAATAYDALVGQSATESYCETITRVVPGSAETSALYVRIRPASLDQEDCDPPKMPQGSEGLSEEAAAAIAAWIDAGAIR